MRLRPVAVGLLVTVPLVLAGCGSSGGSASGTSSSSAASSSSSSASSSSSSPSGGRSAATGSQPSGAVTKQPLDVDGDGRPDTLWIAKGPDADGGVPFG